MLAASCLPSADATHLAQMLCAFNATDLPTQPGSSVAIAISAERH